MLRSGLALFLTLASFTILSCSGTEKPGNAVVNTANAKPATATTPMPAATIDELASGRKIYMDSCSKCHKESGVGGELDIDGIKIKPDDLTSAKIKSFPDDKILRYIMNGVEDEGMPAFKDKLSEGEMRDVVKFIRVELQKMPVPSTSKADTVAN